MDQHASLQQVSGRPGCRLFAMCCAGVSSSYSYGLYEGRVVRAFWWDATAGVVEGTGEKLSEEEGIIFEEFGEEDVLTVMERIGVNYSELQEVMAFQVFELSLPDTSDTATIRDEGVTPAAQEKKKPWWKFW